MMKLVLIVSLFICSAVAFTCTQKGKFLMLGVNCKKYYKCEYTAEYPDLLKKTELSCGAGQVFCPTGAKAGKCFSSLTTGCVADYCQTMGKAMNFSNPCDELQESYISCTLKNGVYVPVYGKCPSLIFDETTGQCF